MELRQIKKMNCGCSVSNDMISMCRMHDPAPELLKAAERLLEAHSEARDEADSDSDDNEYILSSGMVHAIWNIEDVLNGEVVLFRVNGDGFEKIPGKNRIRQPKQS